MERGDPKQLAALAVMAVGAVGFLVTQLGGKSLPAVAKALAATASPDAAPTNGPRPAALTADPFSHRKLAAASVDPATTPPGLPPSAKSPSGKAFPATLKGDFAFPGLPATGPIARAASVPVSPPARLAKAAAGTKPEEASTEIQLEAIAGASDTVAFLAVGGGESQPYRPHDRIRGGIRLLRVDDGAVVLSGPQGELTLEVGERKRI